MSIMSPLLYRLARAALVVALPAMAIALHAAAQDGEAPHPAHIHAGDCETLGEVVAPLPDVAPLSATGAVGADSAIPVEMSVSEVDMPLQELIDGDYAINIHESADAIDVYVACGAIGGVVSDDGLVIGLGELNDSGHHGVAVLEADDDETDVTVYLLHESGGSATAAQEASAPSADTEAVQIKGFAYDPNPIEVPVGGSITWTNQDNVPHTATAQDRSVLQSGAISFGSSFTQSFDTPGSYDYFCEFHPNMKGTIVVK